MEENTIKIPETIRGAYISPLMENFLTFLHKNAFVIIEEAELSAFETQKAEEILVISDEKEFSRYQKLEIKNLATKDSLQW